MPLDIQPPRICSKESPREILLADFKSIRELPIRGGWGYSLEDAVVIDKDDPIVSRGVPFDGVGIENVFVEKRLYEELIIFCQPGEQHSGIKWTLLRQEVLSYKGRSLDRLVFEVTALPDRDMDELKAEFERHYGSPEYDHDEHMQRRESKTIRYEAEYYFDITSFFASPG